MENQTDGREFWPLLPGALTTKVLSPFVPLSCNAVNSAHSLGFLSDSELHKVVRYDMLATPSAMLKIFIDTAHYIDRRRDISEELQRLAAIEQEAGRFVPLWMILARVVISTYPDSDKAVKMFEQIYTWCDNPTRLRPYTLYIVEEDRAYGNTGEAVSRVDALLREQGL